MNHLLKAKPNYTKIRKERRRKWKNESINRNVIPFSVDINITKHFKDSGTEEFNKYCKN